VRAVVQRVTAAAVSLDPAAAAGGAGGEAARAAGAAQGGVGETTGDDAASPRRIGRGLVVLVGVGRDDDEDDARVLADKVVNLRIFEDDEGKMNRSLLEVGGSLLAVSQFTLYGDARRGRRPSFIGAAEPDRARRLFDRFVDEVWKLGVPVKTGWFQEHMHVEIHNDGPVTILLDTDKTF